MLTLFKGPKPKYSERGEARTLKNRLKRTNLEIYHKQQRDYCFTPIRWLTKKEKLFVAFGKGLSTL